MIPAVNERSCVF